MRAVVRHAKNNTAGSVFTYAERQMVKDGSRKERLGRDSFKVRLVGDALRGLQPSADFALLGRTSTRARYAYKPLVILASARRGISSAR